MSGMIRIAMAGSVMMLGCAHSGPRTSADGQPLHSVRAVDERPELLGCARYMPPSRGTHRVMRVQTSFTVSATGTVENVMVGRISPTMGPQVVPADIRAIVSSCAYRPALLDGVAVGVFDASRTFYVAANDLGFDDVDMNRRGRKVESESDDDDKPKRRVPPPGGN